MIDQSMVTSGFDVEFLMTEEFIRYFLLCSLDTGSIPWASEASGTSGTPPVPYRTVTIIHPPHELEDRRLYPVFPEFEGHEHAHLDLTPAYSTHAQELQVTILADDPRGADLSVRAFPAVIDTLVTPPALRVDNVPIDLALGFKVVSTPRDDGLLGDIGIELELVDVSGPLIDAIEQLLSAPDPPPLPTRADILAQLKLTIDRRVPFAVSGGGALQRIETRTFTGDPARPPAIGVYIDLVLQKGPAPTDFLTTVRGDTADAQNFLEPGMKMGFAFPPGTFALLSDDLRFKMAKPKPNDPTEYHYPLMDGDDQIGIIKDITVRPEVAQPPNTPLDVHEHSRHRHPRRVRGRQLVRPRLPPAAHPPSRDGAARSVRLRHRLRPQSERRGDAVGALRRTRGLRLPAAARHSVDHPDGHRHQGRPALRRRGRRLRRRVGGKPDILPRHLATQARGGAAALGSALLHRPPGRDGRRRGTRQPRRFRDGRQRALSRATDTASLGHGDPQRDSCGRRNGRRAGLSSVRSPALPGRRTSKRSPPPSIACPTRSCCP